MHYSRHSSPRRLAVSLCFLAQTAAVFFLLIPGTAQDGPNRRIYAAQAAGDPQYLQDNTGDTTGDASGSRTIRSGSAQDSTTQDPSGLYPSTLDPAVGGDNAGRSNPSANRTGRTTRRRLPVVQPNPLQIMNSPGTTGSIAQEQEKRLGLPPTVRAPANYTLPVTPPPFGAEQNLKPLPLFGYDFFQPARQIILARRRFLLPPPIRVTRPRSRTNFSSSSNGVRRDPSTQSGLNGGLSNGRDYQGNGSAARGDLSSSDPNQSDNNGGDLTAGELAGAAIVGGSTRRPRANTTYGTDAYNSDPNAADPNGTYPNGTDPNSMDANGSDGSRLYAPNGSDTSGYRNSAGNRNQNGSYSTDPESGVTDGSGMDTANLDPGSIDGNGDTMRPIRRRQPTTPDTSFGGETFAGDTQAPGSDIQFPGDDALVRNNGSGAATNASTGQFADPLDTLYRNTLVSLPANYQLQPGDSVTIRYSALTIAPREVSSIVDAQGGVSIGEIGRVSVAGRTAPQAEVFLRQRLERLYRNVDVSVSLRQLRTIQVTLSGAAFAPGTYTVPAAATAFNVLNAAGGPTANGSMRDIRVLRGGRLAGIVDIYPLIGATSGNPGSHSGDLNLQAGDNIYIPSRLSRITIRGQVRQEAIYELTTSETLRDALGYAGGIKPSGVGQTIHIDTVDRGTGRILKDVSVTSRVVPSTPLYDGDSVEIASVRTILTNRVTILGAVQQPGDYALTSGMRVLDLLQRARGTIQESYLNRAELISQNADLTTRIRSIDISSILDGVQTQNVALARNDRLRIYARQEVAYLGRRQVTVRGAVQRPGLYTQSDNMRVSNLLLATGGPVLDAYLDRAVLLHQRGDGTFAYNYLNLRSIINGEDPTQDVPIEDNDVLAVYRIGEAHFTPDHTVKVLGNVVAPGLYARGDKMHISDLLKLSGGFKPGGGTRVTVAHARRPTMDAPEQVSLVQQASAEAIEFNPQGTAEIGTDLVLQDGDIVAVQGNGSIKDHPAVITVTGAVNRPGPISISGNTRLSDAVREAGGLRPEAFPQGAEFTRMSDSLVSNGQLDLADVISHMSDMLNLSQYQRERAKASLALIEAAGSAASGGGSSLPLPGLGGGGAAQANPNLGPLLNNLSNINPVSPGRILTSSQLQPNGAIAVRLAEALRRPGDSEDIILKDGDTLVVPETPTTVQVVGAVVNAEGVLFTPGQSIDYYIQRAGDFTPDAAKERIEVIHAGGGLIPAGKAGAIQPGDLILVPTKVLAEKVGRSGGGFSAFFQGLVGSAVTLKVLTSVFGL